MYFSNSLSVLALAATSAQAINFPSFPSLSLRQTNITTSTDADASANTYGPGKSSCPAVWTYISKELTGMFVSGGTCTDAARASIRAVFHDCFPQGGCDGSLANPIELQRITNTPMAATVSKLAELARINRVSVADMLMFAGCKQGLLPITRYPD